MLKSSENKKLWKNILKLDLQSPNYTLLLNSKYSKRKTKKTMLQIWIFFNPIKIKVALKSSYFSISLTFDVITGILSIFLSNNQTQYHYL